MTVDITDLLDLLGDDPVLEALQGEVEQEVTAEELAAALESDIARPGLLTYDLETIPDESRFPPPEGANPTGLRVSIEDVIKEKIPDLKVRILDATDAELLRLYAAENEHEKPRKGVLDAISDLRQDRETAFEKWVKVHSVDPFACRICCFGWAVGDEDERSMTARTDDEERAVLTAFWRLNNNERVRVGFGITRFDDLVILNRSIALGVNIPRRLDIRKYNNREARDLENIIFANSQTQKCKTVARAWGIRIPCPDVDGSKVYELFQANEMARIAEYCRSDVTVERAMYVIASRMFS